MSFGKQAKRLLTLSSFWLMGFGGIDNAVVRVVAESAMLGPEWTTLAITPPLEVQRTGQKIRMQLPEIDGWVKPEGPLLLRDGSELDIHVELRDQSGERFLLVPVSLGALISFGLVNPEEGAGFRKSRRFTELRVRSSKPIMAKKIDWYCWTGK
ncbi:MAG: hypothetical protein P9F19_08310 [Candidatus Contendobacter sp.]|nr:hypothetical protein [Candidatus Contendobacter sp.]MDG4557374.1 hypothetical protein [Candidatus Contendobacter sp.]